MCPGPVRGLPPYDLRISRVMTGEGPVQHLLLRDKKNIDRTTRPKLVVQKVDKHVTKLTKLMKNLLKKLFNAIFLAVHFCSRSLRHIRGQLANSSFSHGE